MEEVTKCRYLDCFDGREKEQILHELPVCDTRLCVKWLINSGHVDLIGRDLDALRSMKFFICNNHFTEDCYLSKGTLKENAVPSPHWSISLSRTVRTWKIQRKIQENSEENSMEITSMNSFTEKISPSEFEVDQWCRTCATKKPNLVSMTTRGKGTEMSLLSKLKLLIEIDDEDALPTKMCDECVVKLEQSFKFFQQIYIADNTLRHVFPNARASSAPRKPLHSLSEHMRKEQKEREKEKEEDRAPRMTRGGVFRRGRGRPRTRGFPPRSRGRPRLNPLPASFPGVNRNTVASPACDSSVNVSANLKDESLTIEEERRGDTVFSLLTDTCRSDEELDWSDVLKLMNHQEGRVSDKANFFEAPPPISTEEDQQPREQEPQPQQQEQQQLAKEEIIEPQTTVMEAEAQPTKSDETDIAVIKTETEVVRNTEMEGKTLVEVEVKQSQTEEKKEYESGQRVECEFCEERFESKGELQAHLSNVHSQSSGHVCTDCLACYESESLLSKHRALRHGDRKYHCDHCEEEFVEKRVLREHINKCQARVVVALCYSCDFCGLALDSKQLLIEHLKSHPAGLNASSSFRDTVQKSEERSNEEERERGEEGQPATTNTAIIAELKLGEENMHVCDSSGEEEKKKDGEESTTCPDCEEKLENEVLLSIHRMRRHSVKRKDATCLLCENKTFASSEEYERHVLDHCKRLRISP